MATAFNYERPGEYIYRNRLESLTNYLAGNISAIWNSNRACYYDWYNESNNLQIVVRWREHKDLPPRGKYGERICYTRFQDGEIIDLTICKDHFEDCYRCNKLDAVKL